MRKTECSSASTAETDTALNLCKPLARLFNNSLAVGELPKEWKQGRISAIFKKVLNKEIKYSVLLKVVLRYSNY